MNWSTIRRGETSRGGKFGLAAAAAMVCAAGLLGLASLVNQNQYSVHFIVSDQAGTALHTDPALVNAWGLASGLTGPWWVLENGSDAAHRFNGSGDPQAAQIGVAGGPTGIVSNTGSDFQIVSGQPHTAARFIMVTEGGTVAAWSPNHTSTPAHQATVMIDESANGAVFKGIALAHSTTGDRIYVTDFHNAQIDVFDSTWQGVKQSPNAFVDPNLPAHYAPFGIATFNGNLFVTFAVQDSAAHDEMDGPGLGLIDVFTPQGQFVRRFTTGGSLNGPWGLALAPNTFGQFSERLLVANFGDGHITAYNLVTGAALGQLKRPNGSKIALDGLWGIAFGNGGSSGATDRLYFTSGPGDEAHGRFGYIQFAGSPIQGEE